eukprot:3623181-Alexandrium_andersonii.AAC.1
MPDLTAPPTFPLKAPATLAFSVAAAALRRRNRGVRLAALALALAEALETGHRWRRPAAGPAHAHRPNRQA